MVQGNTLRTVHRSRETPVGQLFASTEINGRILRIRPFRRTIGHNFRQIDIKASSGSSESVSNLSLVLGEGCCHR